MKNVTLNKLKSFVHNTKYFLKIIIKKIKIIEKKYSQ
jgi:hypothetical protein